MSVIFLDGESKSGKTAVGRAIQDKLEQNDYSTSLIVAGNFFRRLTWLALQSRPADAADGWLEAETRKVLESDAIYETDYDLSILEEPDVDKLVSGVGQLDFVQAAANPWREKAAQRALDSGVDVIMLDGRNLRSKLGGWAKNNNLRVDLELVIACNAAEAARRYLSDKGNKAPSAEELAATERMVQERREADRQRSQAPYIEPPKSVALVAGKHNAASALELAFARDADNPPLPIRFDNSEVPRDIGLATVSELALLAVNRA